MDKLYDDSSKYVKLSNTYIAEYCKVENYNYTKSSCMTRSRVIQSAGRYVLIHHADGKIYDIADSVRKSINLDPLFELYLYNIDVMGNYAYCVKRGDFSTLYNYYYLKIDLRDMQAYQINEPLDNNFERGVFSDTGDILASTHLESYQIFSVNMAQYPNKPWLDNLAVDYDWKMLSGLTDNDLNSYRLGLRYGGSDAFTKFMNTSTVNPVAAVTNALAFSDTYFYG